jgi:glycosyltransferase involved in cell wall biosynthesis
MKIVYVGTCYPMRGGLAQFNAILARELGRRHEVTFLSFRRQYPDFLFPGKTQYVTEPEVASGVRFDAEPILDSINPWSWFRTARRAAAEKPDLVIYKYWMPFFAPAFGTISRRVKRLSKARILFVCDNIIPHERRPFDLPLTRFALAPVDAFVTMSASVRDDLLRIKPNARWKLVPHPIYNIFGEREDKEDARRRLGLAAGPWLLFFGYVREYKGLDLVLRALSTIPRERGVRLLVAGEFYAGEERYRRMVRELGLADRVRFDADYIPEDRVARYFSACDVVVLPYHSATQSGIVQVAYQLDAPVICTAVGGLAEVVHHEVTGLVVPPDDPRAFAAAVLRFYDEGWEARLREGVQREKERYSWTPMVTAIEELAAE